MYLEANQVSLGKIPAAFVHFRLFRCFWFFQREFPWSSIESFNQKTFFVKMLNLHSNIKHQQCCTFIFTCNNNNNFNPSMPFFGALFYNRENWYPLNCAVLLSYDSCCLLAVYLNQQHSIAISICFAVMSKFSLCFAIILSP